MFIVCFDKLSTSLQVFMSRRGLGKEMKVPTKIRSIKGLFKGDDDYMITDGYSLSITGDAVKSITIWWEERIEKVRKPS